MKILLTGDRGYIGSVLSQMLLSRGDEVRGYDTDYYRDCDTYALDRVYPMITKDIREVELTDVEGVDAVIHLAALSNDPLGDFNAKLTEEINLEATVRLAELAKAAGVRRFVYSSSQSMYGIATGDEELEEDSSDKNPLTAYARTKWEAECRIKLLGDVGDEGFQVVCFRPSTVFGASPRLRCDIVYNNFVGCAYTTGRIEVKSDGTPWRPVVHVRDVAKAFIAGLEAPAELVAGESFNVGIPDGNFSVRQLAEAAERSVPNSSLTFTGEHGGDSRTYRVSFAKILTRLEQHFRPTWDLDRGGKELTELFRRVDFGAADFRGRATIRLAQLQHLSERQLVDENLRWID